MSKHTEGPWHKGIGNGEGSIFGPEGARRDLGGLYPIATIIADGPMYSFEDEANANLIAAAPSLLNALKHVVAAANCNYDMGAMMYEFGDCIKAAIAKAEGSN